MPNAVAKNASGKQAHVLTALHQELGSFLVHKSYLMLLNQVFEDRCWSISSTRRITVYHKLKDYR